MELFFSGSLCQGIFIPIFGKYPAEKGNYMKTVNGVYAFANIFTDSIEDYALAQIKMLCDQKVFENCKIAVMPDVHPGKVGTIGFTSTIGNQIMPNVVGIDIGCGMTMAKIKAKKLEFQKLDTVIWGNVPSGTSIRSKIHRFAEEIKLDKLHCFQHIQMERARRSVGTLGGGNHFIEMDRDEEGEVYITVHSGSRYLGKVVTEYYLNEGQKYLKANGISAPYEMTWLEGELMHKYLEDAQLVQEYAKVNREAIIDEIIKGMKWKILDMTICIHNYVDVAGDAKILRKGAVSAKAGEKVIIPINMRDGIILGTGLGNEGWNESAPHGAGRIMNREAVKHTFTVSDFKKEMKGIYSSCIAKDTLDEAPFAYRNVSEIAEAIKDTVTIEKILKPVYNFKAGGRE